MTTHGGIVEKFAGDAVHGGLRHPARRTRTTPSARSAPASRCSTRCDELELEARIGIESGEVVADESDSTFATGEAVNVAARLQQAAEPGQVLLGPGAHRLTLGRVEAEDVGPIELKGLERDRSGSGARSAPRATGPRAASQQAPLVGRDSELELLAEHLTTARCATGARTCSRSTARPGSARAGSPASSPTGSRARRCSSGRSLPYGEGITYWPLAEMVKCAAGIADDDPLDVAIEKLRSFCEDEAVADLLGLASGVLEAVQAERSQQEIAWAGREWAQQLAQEQPLVLVFEDIHWAEEPLLELIEHLATWVREAPLLLICARAARAARHPPRLGRRPRARDLDRARAAAARARARS